MLDKAQQDFSYYSHEFKDNYRKGVHRLRTLLETPTQAEAFAANFGGVSVILGARQDQPDRNSEELYALLQGSDVIDQAVLTWFTGIYTECTTADDVFGDLDRCEEILANPVMSRAAGASGVCAGKWVATLAGQSCNSFEDITAVAASATAMAAVAASWTAVAAIHRGGNLSVIQQTPSAWAVFTACGSGVIGPAVADLAGLDPADYADMDAVVASELAMDAVVASYISIAAVYGTPAAYAVWKDTAYAAEAMASASSVAVGKAAVELAGLDPDDYADAAAVAASSTAMQAVAASAVALNLCLKNGTARGKLAGSAHLQGLYSTINSTVNNTSYFDKTSAQALDSGSKRATGGTNTDNTATANQSLALIQKMGSWSNGRSTTTVIYHLQGGAQVHSVTTSTGPINSGTGVTANKICIGGCKMTETGDGGCWGVWIYAK